MFKGESNSRKNNFTKQFLYLQKECLYPKTCFICIKFLRDWYGRIHEANAICFSTRNKSIPVKRRASKRRKKVILENRNPLPGGTRERKEERRRRRKGTVQKDGRQKLEERGDFHEKGNRKGEGNRPPRRLLRAQMFESGFSKWPQGDSIGIIRNGEARWRDKWPLTRWERKVWRGRPLSRILENENVASL